MFFLPTFVLCLSNCVSESTLTCKIDARMKEKDKNTKNPPEMKLKVDNSDGEDNKVSNREYMSMSYVICESECHLCAKTVMSYVICESKCHLCAKNAQSKAEEAAKTLLALSEAVKPYIPSAEKKMEIANSDSNKLKEGETLYSCKECDKSYTRRDVLRKHFRTKHIEVWPSQTVFNCTECGKVYGRQDCLRKHIRKKHLKPINKEYEVFFCAQCKNTYSSRDKLTRHLIQHTASDGKPFECTECQERFSRKDAMSRHIKNQHSLVP